MRPGRFSKLRLAKSRASNSKQLHIPCVHHFGGREETQVRYIAIRPEG
jgi:hypothetical protein